MIYVGLILTDFQNYTLNECEQPHKTGPRKQKIPHIADARIATGRLTEEIKIGSRMIGMIERSATHARMAPEEAAGQRRAQSYMNLMMTVDKTPPPPLPPPPT